MLEPLSENEHCSVEVDEARRVVVVRRKSTRPDADELARAYLEMMDTHRPEHRSFALIIDSRLAPGRTGDDFEETFKMLRRRVEERYQRVVMLVSSQVGKLQSTRLSREDGVSQRIALDEESAFRLAWED